MRTTIGGNVVVMNRDADRWERLKLKCLADEEVGDWGGEFEVDEEDS